MSAGAVAGLSATVVVVAAVVPELEAAATRASAAKATATRCGDLRPWCRYPPVMLSPCRPNFMWASPWIGVPLPAAGQRLSVSLPAYLTFSSGTPAVLLEGGRPGQSLGDVGLRGGDPEEGRGEEPERPREARLDDSHRPVPARHEHLEPAPFDGLDARVLHPLHRDLARPGALVVGAARLEEPGVHGAGVDHRHAHARPVELERQ